MAAAAAAEAAAVTREGALLSEEREIRTILEWSGFTLAVQREHIATESFQNYTEIKSLGEKDVTEISDSFTKRTPAAHRVVSGKRRIKKLKSLVHWSKDFCRINATPSIDGLDQGQFLTDLDIAARREEIRKVQISNSESVMKQASPGTLETEGQWNDWEPAFENYLNAAYGTNGVPLAYVIRKQEVPDPTATYNDFTERCIACAALNGPAYDADKTQVRQFIVSFTQGHLS